MIRNVNKLVRKKMKKHDKAYINQKKKIQQHSKLEDSLQKSFTQNIDTLQSIYENCPDVVFRSFLLFGKIRAMIIYIEGLSDTEAIEKSVLAPLMQETDNVTESLHDMLDCKLTVSNVSRVHLIADCIGSISAGNPLLLCKGEDSGFILSMAKHMQRNIEEPPAESVIRGPREGFIESLQANISLLRRIIKSPAMKIQTMKIGNYTQTTVALVYINGLADQTLIEEAANRLKRIQADGILESEYIEEAIKDHPFSPFPLVLSTERPDVTCANLLEGRIAILVDGTPFTLIAPISFLSLLQSQEDYYQNFIASTFIRWLRYLFLGISLLFPALYVAITTFHQEMIPGALLLSIAASREAVPFPALVEVLLMEATFEALREAGVRLPRQIGSAVSIVGALVIGQSAVQAGLVSAPMIIVVAVTGIASFMIPRYAAGITIRLIRFPIIFLAGTLGLLGIMMGILALAIHLCSLRSLGEPYLAPLAPLKRPELKDTLWRAPFWMMNQRPHFTGESNHYRQAPDQKPSPNKGGES